MVEFLEEAMEELLEAMMWYEEKKSGLGVRFRDEIFRVIDQLARDSLLWRERAGGYRRINCPVFPYYLPYIIRESKIIIVAVAHERRRPDYWRNR